MPERNLHRLADMLESSADAYLNAAAAADPSVEIATPNGLVIDPSTMATLLLGEQLIHGLDISRTANIPWTVSVADAFLVIPGVMSIAPQYLRPQRAAGVHISFQLRMRGGPSYRMAVDDGTAVVTAAGEKADCVITADPVAFLLLGYGRISQLSPVLRGRLRPGGRKPWLAMKFGALLSSPELVGGGVPGQLEMTAGAQTRRRAVRHAEHPDARVRNVFRQLRSFRARPCSTC